MSGGSYDYLFGRIQDAATQVERTRPTPLRRAFAEHLRLVAKAMHAVEWVDSCDYGSGDEDEVIRAVLGDSAASKELAVLIEDARNARDALSAAIAKGAETADALPGTEETL
jgi:hypothetical protein